MDLPSRSNIHLADNPDYWDGVVDCLSQAIEKARAELSELDHEIHLARQKQARAAGARVLGSLTSVPA